MGQQGSREEDTGKERKGSRGRRQGSGKICWKLSGKCNWVEKAEGARIHSYLLRPVPVSAFPPHICACEEGVFLLSGLYK